MNKSILTGLVAGVALASAVGAIGGYRMLSSNPGPAFATVLEIKDVISDSTVPREVCEDVVVTRQQPVKDQHQVIGTVAGAILGGVVGNQIGGGSGKKVATVAGAAAGGYAGNKTQENMQANNTYTATERKCRTVMDTHSIITGYDVRYQLGDVEGTVRMKEAPGERIPVVNGELVLSSPKS